MYTIESDRKSGLLTVTLGGFWDVNEANAFVRDEQEAVGRLGRKPGEHLVLADVTEFAVQTQEVSEIIRDLVMNATFTSTKIALVGKIGLSAFQSKRITARDQTRFFDSRAEALEWLIENVPERR